MAGKFLELAVILKAVDQMSGTVRGALGGASSGYGQLANSQERAAASMQKGLILGAGADKAISILKEITDKYGEVDAAQRQLRISEMKPGGNLDEQNFDKQVLLTKALSRVYGEHQTNYVDMIKVMKNYNLDDTDIFGGTAASVALLSKLFQSSADEGALFASRMKTDFRVAPDEMKKMVDMAVRLKQLNTGLTGPEMLHNITEFSAGIALSAQNLGMHGAKDASELEVLGAMYTAKGIDAPQVATTLRRIFENITKPERLKAMDEAAAKYGKHLHFFDNKGNFEGVANFVAQLGTLKNLKPSAVTEILGVLGSSQGMSGVMLKNISKFGTDDFIEFNKQYANQGTPEQKLAEMMGGQTEQLKRATNDLENLTITLGKHYNPAVNKASELSGGFFRKVDDFASSHGTTTNIIEGLFGMGTAAMVAGSAFHFLKYAWTSWGAGSIFRWIGSFSLAGAISSVTAFANSMNFILWPAIKLIGSELAGLVLPPALLALAGFGLYKTFQQSAAVNKAYEDRMKQDKVDAKDNAAFEKYTQTHHSAWQKSIDRTPITKLKNYKELLPYSELAGLHPDIAPQLKLDLQRRNNPMPTKTSLSYSPTIIIQGDAATTKKDIKGVLDTHGNKLLDLIEKQRQDHLRTTYK